MIQKLVEEFHRKHHFPIASSIYNKVTTQERLELISEEFTELIRAFRNNFMIDTADALADLAYVVYGAAVAFGIDLDPVIQIVHRSNMTKDVGEFKPTKGRDFVPPTDEISAELNRQYHARSR